MLKLVVDAFVEMEKNANPHRDPGGSVLCATIADVKTVAGVKDACEQRQTLTTCASASVANATPCTETSDAVEVIDSRISPSKIVEPKTLTTDRLSNGMGCESTAGNKEEGGTSKLVNNPTGEQPSAPSSITNVQADALEGGMQEPAKLSKPGPDKTQSAGSASNDHTVSEGGTSIAGESRSFDSLESFSNLNSCPSSDLNSEGLEDKGLALALQSEYGAEGKVPCLKDRGTGQSLYHIKWIKWKEENTPIITQNENGPCPLLAIMNVLLLSWKVI